ncbi:hypothetical protein PPERSA_05924 [Pseudocohnilembus persalinus]|uniref:Uncharacterized protein n=1 Tax=Pseudocohnilembus persalinus TaxID=266149 RepID=A0A0V0R455_PSEPJ|nr:hypothetical protein PPERSA_05924 [Pseudocohnilembus persalinus]|eukprot:KRX09255.1 hypothetical protein PPERSA_05924 [Pseudocohnilembus persalinus]
MDIEQQQKRGRPKKKKALEQIQESRKSRLKQKSQQKDDNSKYSELNDELDLLGSSEQIKSNNQADEEQEKPQTTFRLKKKKKVVEEQQKKRQMEEEEEKKRKDQKIIKIEPQPLNINKSKNPNYLAVLKNNLSQCNKLLQDKKQIHAKKWKMLKSSNLSQQEYIQTEENLKREEVEEIQEIKLDTINKLHQSDIQGFELIDNIVESFKEDFWEENQNMKPDERAKVVFELDDKVKQTIIDDQILLLEKLMDEKNLITANVQIDQQHFSQFNKNNYNNDEDDKIKQIQPDPVFTEDNSKNNLKTIFLSKYFEETSSESNNMTQYQYNTITGYSQYSRFNYTSNNFYNFNRYGQQGNNNYNSNKQNANNNENTHIEIEDGESRSLMGRIFDDYQKFLKIDQNDYCILEKRKKTLLLDIKSDELFQDENYQKDQYLKYQKLLKEFNAQLEDNQKDLSEQQVQKLVQITAYIINNVHYYKKFKLNCDLIHPMELLYIVEQVERNYQKRKKQEAIIQQQLQKQQSQQQQQQINEQIEQLQQPQQSFKQ